MEKKTKDGRGWIKRYFELERTQVNIYAAKGGKFKETFNLHGVPIAMNPDNPRTVIIKTEEREWNLRAETPEIASEWFFALKLRGQAR